MKTRILAGIVSVLFASTIWAQQPPSTPGPEHKLLQVGLGKWKLEETAVQTPFGPVDKATYTAVGRMINGGFHAETKGAGKTQALGQLAWTEIAYYDADRKGYRNFYCDSTGMATDSPVEINGNTRTSRWESKAGTETYKCRSISTFSADGRSYTYEWQYSSDGVTWKPWLKGTAKKTGK